MKNSVVTAVLFLLAPLGALVIWLWVGFKLYDEGYVVGIELWFVLVWELAWAVIAVPLIGLVLLGY